MPHVLSVFPQILFLAPVSPALLRITAGIVLLLVAWAHMGKREELSRIDFLVVGRGVWIPVLAAIIEFAIAAALIGGIYTQIAAILGALAALKFFVWKGRYGAMIPLSRTASALLLVICISLVFTGPGAFAFDWPL